MRSTGRKYVAGWKSGGDDGQSLATELGRQFELLKFVPEMHVTPGGGNWESNEAQPMVHCLPGIIAFLGHNPLPAGGDLIGKFKRLRSSLGLTQEQLAQKLGIDESTVAGWEQAVRIAAHMPHTNSN